MNPRNMNLDSIEEHKNCRSLLWWFYFSSYIQITRIYRNFFYDTKWLSMVENKYIGWCENWPFKVKYDFFWTIFIKADHNAGCFICFLAKNNLTPTWFEHAAFWSGVRRATIAPRSPSYRKWSNCWKQCVHTGTSKNDARNLSWSREIVNLCSISSFLSYETILSNKVFQKT